MSLAPQHHAPGRDHRRHPRPLRPLQRARTPPPPTRRCSPRPSTAWSERHGLRRPGAVGEFVAGAVPQAQPGLQPRPRDASSAPGWTRRTPAYDIQQACGTGLQAVIAVANKIALGSDRARRSRAAPTPRSDAPLGVNDGLRRIAAGGPPGEARWRPAAGAGAQIRPGAPPVPDIPRNAEPRTGLSMGEHAAVTALRWRHRPRGAGRTGRGRATSELAAALRTRLLRGPGDAVPRPDPRPEPAPGSTLEKLAPLGPVFGLDAPDPTMTAGNSTPLTDGAAAVLLGSEEWAARRGLPSRWRTSSTQETAAVDFVRARRADGLLMAPAYAVPRTARPQPASGCGDFDFYEVHEAFASQRCSATLEPRGRTRRSSPRRVGPGRPARRDRPPRLNVTARRWPPGHPFAATGGQDRGDAGAARLLAEGARAAGLISMCAAGGQGVVAILERRVTPAARRTP